MEEVLFVAAHEEGLRLDQLLVARYQIYSRTYFQELIQRGLVQLAGKCIKKRAVVSAGDRVGIQFPPSGTITLEPEEMEFNRLYEDEELLALNKPPDLVVHPAAGLTSGTIANGLAFLYGDQFPAEGDLQAGIIHRLDKDTSGVLLTAKNPDFQEAMKALFAERKVSKMYLALVWGNPGEGEIRTLIDRHPVHRQRRTVTTDRGREAYSGYRTLVTVGDVSCVQIFLHTGRTHQARVHMSHLGHPIVGDRVYGCEEKNRTVQGPRQMLHAHQIAFTHPRTNQPLSLQSPLPEDFLGCMQKAGIDPDLVKRRMSLAEVSNSDTRIL